jgi:indolepyruvate ferredoxin oxidoreductase beta subunit
MAAGHDVKMSEVHEMAQRGGSVSNQVRFGARVFSPIIGKGQADILVAFEKMEALRWLEYLKPTGVAVVNDFQIPSGPILVGQCDYPADILTVLRSRVNTVVVPAYEIAAGLGNVRTMNLVLLGALVQRLRLHPDGFITEIARSVKPSTIEINQAAFHAGMVAVQ